jgi:hypothetical protein
MTPLSLQATTEPRNAFLGEGEPTRLANEVCRESHPCPHFETNGTCRPPRRYIVIRCMYERQKK